ncbi:MAG: DUF362 domain-containing protein [Deltaproteobacteria bacterium]|nr:MAG: DUF362 domain-containing protein [Deltaproteobacteria bacterium]
MRINSTSVALLDCTHYKSREIKVKIDQLCTALGFKVSGGSRVLLKPNLLSGRSADHLACTHPVFVAAVAEWFVEQDAKVVIGDSPAFGTAKGVMHATGIEKALARLPVECVNFDQSTTVKLSGGVTVDLARAALECDVLVNLPRVKAHSQLYMSLAVKNYFGTVVGFQKPWWHLKYGNHAGQFASHLVDLLSVLPSGVTLLDGIVAMHDTGPIGGLPYSLGLVAASTNPVALDTGLLKILGLDMAQSALWQECVDRGLAGADPEMLDYPILKPAELMVDDFKAPTSLKPVSFNPLRMLFSACKRFVVRLKESS